MTIRFQNVTPAPLAGVTDLRTNIWGKQISFEPCMKYNVVAASGKGKTTFIHSIYGLRNDFTGELMFDDENVRAMNADRWSDIRRDYLSIVFQDLRLFLRLTAMENIQVKLALYNTVSSDKVKNMAQRLQVAHVIDKPTMTLSYGERQRVAIIRALVQPFNWLLLDEPFSHLDKVNAAAAALLITEEVAERKAGLIINSLNADDAFAYDFKLLL